MTWRMTNKEKYKERKLNKEFKKKYGIKKKVKKSAFFNKRIKNCPFEYSRIGIQQSTQIANLLRDLYNCNQGLKQEEINFVNEMLGQFSWNPKQSAKISKLRQKVFDIGFLT